MIYTVAFGLPAGIELLCLGFAFLGGCAVIGTAIYFGLRDRKRP